MRASRVLFAFLAVLALAGFAYGLTELLLLGYRTGDVYAEYSSLRPDPLGAKAFYESLEAMPNLRVERNTKPLSKLSDSGSLTVFLFGLYAGDLFEVPAEDAKELNAISYAGGRLVITCSPMSLSEYMLGKATMEEVEKDREKKRKEKSEQKEKPAEKADSDQADRSDQSDRQDPEEDKKEDDELPTVSLLDQWGFTYDEIPLPEREDIIVPDKAVCTQTDGFPSEILWRSPLVFSNLNAAWRVLYQRQGKPVIIERKLSAGTLVLCSDSYLVSNEALADDRCPEILAWLVGDKTRVVFDETHLGYEENPGVVALARRYRLDGVALALALVALLFVWRSASSLVPPAPDRGPDESAPPTAGKDAAGGLVNLLRRSVSTQEFIPVCVNEWAKCFARSRPDLRGRLAWMQAMAEAEGRKPRSERDPLVAYRTISETLRKEWKR